MRDTQQRILQRLEALEHFIQREPPLYHPSLYYQSPQYPHFLSNASYPPKPLSSQLPPPMTSPSYSLPPPTTSTPHPLPPPMTSPSHPLPPPIIPPCSSQNASSTQEDVCPDPLPLSRSSGDKALPSSEIKKDKLSSVQEVLDKYSHLIKKGATIRNIRMLSIKLAKEAIFGADVMARCTPGGTREYPGLPRKELYELKKIALEQYPQYWNCLHIFEDVCTWSHTIKCASVGMS